MITLPIAARCKCNERILYRNDKWIHQQGSMKPWLNCSNGVAEPKWEVDIELERRIQKYVVWALIVTGIVLVACLIGLFFAV